MLPKKSTLADGYKNSKSFLSYMNLQKIELWIIESGLNILPSNFQPSKNQLSFTGFIIFTTLD